MITIRGFVSSDFNVFEDAPPNIMYVTIDDAEFDKIIRVVNTRCAKAFRENKQITYPLTNKFLNKTKYKLCKCVLFKKTIIKNTEGDRCLRSQIIGREVELEINPVHFKYEANDRTDILVEESDKIEGIKFNINKIKLT
jgi:hypothetical protein